MSNLHKKSLITRLRKKYRLIIYNDSSFKELLSFRVSRLDLIAISVVFSMILIVIIMLLLVFTPVRGLIPGYPNSEVRGKIISNFVMVDSLKAELDKRDRFFSSMRNVISGKDVENAHHDMADSLSNPQYKDLSFSRSIEDSLFRSEIEEDEKFNLSIVDAPKVTNISGIHFFPPVKGVITSSFDGRKQHYGTDVVAAKNERISAVLAGTVILAEWTLNTGYVIQIQHSNNLVSIYKHNSELLKKAGDQVKAGEAIALLGNSGELTSGPHLHFELWHNGKPLNAENYIRF